MGKSINDMRIDRITDLKIELQKAKQDLSDAEKALADFDNDLAKNKDILHDAYSDNELSHLVSIGEFPADKVDEYKETKRMLLKYIAYAPTIREPLVQARDSARDKVASMQSQLDTETEAFNVSISRPKINAKTVFGILISITVLAGIIACLSFVLRDSNSGEKGRDNPEIMEVVQPSPSIAATPTNTPTSKPTEAPTPTPVPTPTPSPHESRPENGAVLWYAGGYEWPCEFVVENHDYLDYCFLFVDAITNDYVQTMYVRGNSTATFSMPTGLYELRYACGPSARWCCFWDQFEDVTAYGMSDEPFYFEVTDETYTVWTVAFDTADPTMDNMETSDIDEDEFFGT